MTASGIQNKYRIGQRVVTIHDNKFTVSNVVCIMWNHEKNTVLYELNGIETRAFEEKELAVDYSGFFKEATNLCVVEEKQDKPLSPHSEIPATEGDMNDLPTRLPFRELTQEEYRRLKEKEEEDGNA